MYNRYELLNKINSLSTDIEGHNKKLQAILQEVKSQKESVLDEIVAIEEMIDWSSDTDDERIETWDELHEEKARLENLQNGIEKVYKSLNQAITTFERYYL